MKTLLRVFLCLAMALSCSGLIGCAKDDTPEPPGGRYNTQGWSRPEPWEGSAGFGPLPQSR